MMEMIVMMSVTLMSADAASVADVVDDVECKQP